MARFLHLRKMWLSLASLKKRKPSNLSNIVWNWGHSLRRHLSGQSQGPAAKPRSWTADEDRKILELREQGLTAHEIATEIGDRSYNGVLQRFKVLKSGNITQAKEQKTFRRWSAEEEALLMEKFQHGLTPRQLASYFPGRSFLALQRKAAILAFRSSSPSTRSGRSSDDDVLRIIDMRLNEAASLSRIALELERTVGAICKIWYTRCKHLISKESWEAIRSQRQWSKKETSHLLELHRQGTMSRKDVRLQFPSRSEHAVRLKIESEQLHFPRSSAYKKRATQAPDLVETDASSDIRD